MSKFYQKASLLKRWLIQTEHTDLYPDILNKLIDAHYDLVIDIDTGSIDHFFQWVYNNTYLHHVRYHGKDYYERSNVWSKRMEPLERPLHDPDNHCDSMSKYLCDAPPGLVPSDATKVKYIIEKHGDNTFRSSRIDMKIGEVRLSELDLRRVLFISSNSEIIFKNASGPNTNHLGSTHCQLYLAYEGVIAINMPITLYKFSIICYRLKSHKFNFGWESYERCQTSNDKDTKTIKVYFR